jgi:hypothetical protein
MKPSHFLITTCVLLYAHNVFAVSPDAWGIQPAHGDTSLYNAPNRAMGAGGNDPTLPFGARIIPLEAFNDALSRGLFRPSGGGISERFAAGNAGALSDPSTMGLRAVVQKAETPSLATGGMDIPLGENVFIVVSDARYSPYSNDEIEAQSYFVVSGYLNKIDENNEFVPAKTPWISFTNPPFLFVDNKASSTPITFPTPCCNTDHFEGGQLSGYRCINPLTSRTTASSPEAAFLPMGRAQNVRFYVLAEPTVQPLGIFSNIQTPPAQFPAALQCLSCTRSVGDAPFGCNQPIACHVREDCTRLEYCNTQTHRCEMLREVECNIDDDCGFNETCLKNTCVSLNGFNNAPNPCSTHMDCALKETCNLLTHTCQLRQAAASPNNPPHHGVVNQQGSYNADINNNVEIPQDVSSPFDAPNEEEEIDLGDIDFASGLGEYDFGWMNQAQEQGACPRDNDITVLHCLDTDFMDSPCGQKYQPASGPPNYAPAGDQPNLCAQLIARALRNQPKRNPRMQEPVMERVCEEEYIPHVGNANERPNDGPPQAYGRSIQKPSASRTLPIQQAAQAGGYNMSLDPEVEEDGFVSLAQDLNEQDDYVTECRDQPVEGTNPQAVVYQQLWSQYNTLYQLDGRPLQERFDPQASFQWDADTDYNRRALQYTGGTDTQSAQDRRVQVTHQQNNRRAREDIQARERRFAGEGVPQKILNCNEYVFQRFYDHSRFLEEAALLGANDWAIWELAFGDVLLPTSIGSRMLNPHWDGVKTYLGEGVENIYGSALRALLPGQWDAYRGAYDGQPNDRDARYYKNVFFSTVLPETVALNDFAFPYFNLMRTAQTPEGNQGGVRHSDLRTVRDWRYHQRTGQVLREKGYTLRDFDNFSNRELPAFIAARNRLLRAIVNNISPYPNNDRAPTCKEGSCCSSCACKLEKWILPWHATNRTHADRFFEWMDHGYMWGYVEDRRAQAQRNNPRNGDFCTQRITQEIRDAASEVHALLTRAELKGYLDLNTATVADWSPRWFSETAKALFSHEKEELYKWCKLWTNDDFDVYKQRFAHINHSENGNLDAILRNYHTLDASFATYQTRLNQLPASVRRGTDWHRGDAVEAGDAGFGVSYEYHSDIDVDDYTNNRNIPAPMDVTVSAEASFGVGVEVFGVEMPLLSAGIDFDSEDGADLPVVRILDFDMLSPARDLAGDALDAVNDLSNLVQNPVTLPEGGVGDFTFARQEYNVDIVSFQFSYIIPVSGPLVVVVSGGMSGSAGVRTSASYNTQSNIPVSFNAEVSPYVNTKVFLEGAVSAVVASVAIRTTIIIIDFSLPLTAGMDITANPIDPTDLNLDFDIVGKGSLEMLSGNIRLRICAGIWPFEYCYRKKIFEWDAAMHYDFTLFDLGLDEPVSLYDLALAEILR